MNKIKICIGALVLLLFTIAACDKLDALQDRGVVEEGAGIKVMHLSPDAPTFNIMVDSLRAVTALASTTGTETGLVFGNIFPNLAGGYALVPGGGHTVSAKVSSTSATMPGQTIVTKPTTLDNGKFYTIAIVDSLSRLDAVIVEDDRNVADTSKAYFRIANFMLRGTADVEFIGSSGGYNFMKNGISFKTVSNFDTLTPSPASYKVLLRSNGTATRLDSVTLTPLKGRKYTLYTRGVVGQTGSTNTRRPLIFSTITF